MKTIDIEDIEFPESINDAYLTCKYLERQGVSLEDVTLGNVHDIIEEIVDDHQLPVTQVIENNSIEGYLIGAY